MQANDPNETHDPTIRVGALHALAYCERLFFLEEVEEIRVADAAVYSGRALHAELDKDEGDSIERLVIESDALGLRGQLDALRRRDGKWLPYEHKKGRSKRSKGGAPEAWSSDRLQVGAYALLLEEAKGAPVHEARIRYHADNALVRIAVDEQLRADVLAAVARAKEVRGHVQRPAVCENERACARCSLAPVCLPEEERLARDACRRPVRLTPKDDDREVVHVTEHGSRVGRSGDEIRITPLEGEVTRLPIQRVAHLVLHGGSQISTQAIHRCVEEEIAVSWITAGGRYVGTVAASGPTVQRRIRQYEALSDESFRLATARRLVMAKIEGQLRFVLRATRGKEGRGPEVELAVDATRAALRGASKAGEVSKLLGYEGQAASAYFSCWRSMIGKGVDERLRYGGRSRRPPRDRVSALLGFGYAMLLKDVTASILAVGLEPGFGFYHRPRSAAPPLSLDLLELFRVPLVDMPVVASINRGQWQPEEDFVVTGPRVWLSRSGRRKLIEVYERRRREQWKHSVVGYSLSYARMVELEVRLLEKEWSGAPGLFGRFRLR